MHSIQPRATSSEGNKERLFYPKNQNKGKCQEFLWQKLDWNKTEKAWSKAKTLWCKNTHKHIYQPVNIDIKSSWSRIWTSALLKFLLDPRERVREWVLLQHRLHHFNMLNAFNNLHDINYATLLLIILQSPAPVGPWYIALKTCCHKNVRNAVGFYDQSANFPKHLWWKLDFWWRHKSWRESWQLFSSNPICPIISGKFVN